MALNISALDNGQPIVGQHPSALIISNEEDVGEHGPVVRQNEQLVVRHVANKVLQWNIQKI